MLPRLRSILLLLLLLLGATATVSEILEVVWGFTLIPVAWTCQTLLGGPCTAPATDAFRNPAHVPLPFLFLALHTLLLALFPWSRLWQRRAHRVDHPERWAFRFFLASATLGSLVFSLLQWLTSRAVGTYPILESLPLLPATVLAWWDMDRGSFRRSLRQAVRAEHLIRPLLSGLAVVTLLLLSTAWYWERRNGDLLRSGAPSAQSRLAEWRSSKPVSLALPKEGLLELALRPGDMAPDASVPHLVEFIDFECPPCLESLSILTTLPPEISGAIRITLVHFPLCRDCNEALPHSPHPFACALALESLAATAAGQGFEFAQRRARYPLENPRSVLGRHTGLEAHRPTLASHVAAGRALGLTGTPALFLDGKPLALPKDRDQAILLLRLLLQERSPTPRWIGKGISSSPLHVFGNRLASLEVVEFSSYECPFSKEMHRTLSDWMKTRPVALVMKTVPVKDRNGFEFVARYHLALGHLAQTDPDPAARRKWERAAATARDYQYQLAGRSVQEIQSRLEASARELGVNLAALKAAFNAETNKTLYARNMEDLGKANITETPTLFIQGKRYQGPATVEGLERFVRDLPPSTQGAPR